MADNVPDESLAAAILRSGLLPPERLESAREVQRQALEAGLPITLGEVLVQKHLLTAAQREQLEQQVRAQPQGGVRSLGNYQLARKLGGGPKGTVYLAEDSMLGRQVALRVLPPNLAADIGYLGRFKQEGIAAAKVSDLHVATTFAVGQDAGYRYHVSEFCEGETLDKKLARQKLFSEEETLSLAVQVAAGLEAAHAAGLVHRELRPVNILVTPDGTAKILDFGQAKPSGTATDLNAAYYASPEQARGDTEFDARADLYSFGAILYHLLTGRPPFTGPSDVMVMTMHLAEPLPDPCEVRPGLSEGLAYILRRCLAKEPKDRYQDAAELREDLERVRNGEEPAALARKRPQPTARLRGTSGERPRSGRRGTDAQGTVAPRYRHGLEETRRARRLAAPARDGAASGRQRAVEPGERADVQRTPPPEDRPPPPAATPVHRPPSSALPVTRTPIPVPTPPKTPQQPAPPVAEHIPEPAAPRREGAASSRQRALESGRQRGSESGERERAQAPHAPPAAPVPKPPSSASLTTRTPIPVPTPPRTPQQPAPPVAPAPEPSRQPTLTGREATASGRRRALESGRQRAAEPSERERARVQHTPVPAEAAVSPSAPAADSPPRAEAPVSRPPSAALPAARVPTPAPAPPSAAQPAAETPAQAASAVPSAPEPTPAAQGAREFGDRQDVLSVPEFPGAAPAGTPAEGPPPTALAAAEAAPTASPPAPATETAGSAAQATATAPGAAASPASATPEAPVATPPPRRKRRLVAVLLFLFLLSAAGGLVWLFSVGPLKPLLKPLLSPKEAMGAPFAPLAYWAVIGPFPAKDGRDLDAVHPPDTGRDFRGTFAGKAGPVKWKLVQMRSSSVSFDRELGAFSQCNAYGVTWLDCPEETKAVLGIGSDDACRVFLNGQKVHETREQRGCSVDSDKVPAVLKKGPNELLIKIGQGSGAWGFAATVRGADGKPIPGLKGCLPAEIAPPPPEPPKKPAAPAPKPAAPQKSPTTRK